MERRRHRHGARSRPRALAAGALAPTPTPTYPLSMAMTRREALKLGLSSLAGLAAGGKLMRRRMPVAYVPHGGGPWPWVELGFDRRELDGLRRYLEELRGLPPEPPRALLVVSAHWEADRPTVMSAARPPMLYDYYG